MSVGEWQRGDPLVRSRQAIVAPLSPSVESAKRLYVEELSQMEYAWYRREMRRRPVMISTSDGRNMRIRNRNPRPRAPRPQRTYYEEPPEEASPHNSDTASTIVLYRSDSNSSSSYNSDNDSSNSSSDCSDWVADHPGVPLQPPKRSKRKPNASLRYSPQPPTAKKNSPASTSDAGVLSQSSSSETSPRMDPVESSSYDYRMEIPEPYRPSEWLCAVQPRKAPYHPQMGDECVYFKQGHARYLEAVCEKNVYKVGPRDKPWEKKSLQECEYVKIVGMKYMIRPPRLVCLKLVLDSGVTFKVRYHDMPDVLDFLVLRQTYEGATERHWAPGDKFRCMIDDGWWMGTVVQGGHPTGDQFLSLRVCWDNGELEQMSPWDLEPIDDTRLPTEVGGWVGVLPSELEALLYRPRAEEWPGGDRKTACQMIARGIDQVMALAIAEPFFSPVDLSVYPSYAYIVAYPIDLSTIKARFQNHFYRRVTSAQFDVRYLATNAEKFNLTHSHIVRKARIVTDLCLQVISNPSDIDVAAAYQSLMDSYQSSDSDVPLSKQSTSNGRSSSRDWIAGCRNILNGLVASPDSVPFREPVPLDILPEYCNVVTNPMDLGTVRLKLDNRTYLDPRAFAQDVLLVFSNSKMYNTNKKSRIYSMTLRLETLFDELYQPVLKKWNETARRQTENHEDNGDGGGSSSDDSWDGTSRVQNGHHHSTKNESDSWDSDAPLRAPKSLKGKGKGKGAAGCKQDLHMPLRSSQRYVASTSQTGASTSQQQEQEEDDDEEPFCSPESEPQEDSGDSYKPTRRSNGVLQPYPTNKKKGKMKMEKRKGRQVHGKRSKVKRRKRGSGGGAAMSRADSSSESRASVASGVSGGRYESDHSFTLRLDTDSSDSDTPLHAMRVEPTAGGSQENTSTSVRLRRSYMDPSDDSRAGPSGSSGRARRLARDNKRPRYNEDSEEDNIASISKRFRAQQQPRQVPVPLPRQPQLVMRPYPRAVPTPEPIEQQEEPLPSAPSPPQLSSSESAGSSTACETHSAAVAQLIIKESSEQDSPAEDAPLSVSSRGRVRRLTAKARGLLRD